VLHPLRRSLFQFLFAVLVSMAINGSVTGSSPGDLYLYRSVLMPMEPNVGIILLAESVKEIARAVMMPLMEA
jgi:hypothetical protein